MSLQLSGSAVSQSKFTFTENAALGTTFTGSPQEVFSRQFATTDVSKIYFTNLLVGTGGTTIDVTSLTDVFGNALSFSTIKHIQITNNDGTNNLTINASGTNLLFGALPTLVGQAPASGSQGSSVNLTTNLTVSGSVKDIVLAASAGTLSVDVVIVGQ